jgi:hypothetical protein
VNCKVKADVLDTQLEEIVKLGPSHSPVVHTLAKGVSVSVTAQRM